MTTQIIGIKEFKDNITTLQEIQEAREQVKKGEVYQEDEVYKKLGL